MKASFYFVLWILIYPLLGLLHNEFIYNNSFFVALVIVYLISWLVNKWMPQTLLYERVSHTAPVLEDVYTGNVKSFYSRLSRQALVESITGIYFCVTTVALGVAMFKTGADDWFALLIFAFFSIGAIVRSSRLVNAYFKLRANPTPEECMEITEDTYKLDYASYYESRLNSTYADMFPPRPRYFKVFQIFSLVIAIVAVVLGLIYAYLGVLILLRGTTLEMGTMAGMYFLYGMLAVYFGVKDIISSINSMKSNPR